MSSELIFVKSISKENISGQKNKISTVTQDKILAEIGEKREAYPGT